MNRALSSFVLFVLVLAAALTGFASWLGPATQFALSSDLRAQPYYLLVLDREADALPLDGAVATDGGERLYVGAYETLLAGRLSRDEWATLTIYRFDTGADVLKLVTASHYREARDAAARVVLGTAEAPQTLSGQALSLWLFDRRDELLLEAHSALLTTASGQQGRGVWSADVDVLHGEDAWETLRVVAFPGVTPALAWHDDPATQTEVALMRARYAESSGMLFKSGSRTAEQP